MQAPDTRLPETGAGRADDLVGEIERMTALARDGDWLRVERLAATVSARIAEMAGSGRRETLAEAHAGIERLAVLALSARTEIGEKLAAIRHGRKATASYRTNGGR